MRKLTSIELLRGLAVSMVVLYHMYAVQTRYFGANDLPEIFEVGNWGVDIFFVISGVVMYKSAYGGGKGAAVPSFLIARISRIYPAYWVITLAIFTLAQFHPGLVNSSYEVKPKLLNSMLLLPDLTNPWLNVGWSLIYEMWFYLLLGVLLLLKKSHAIVLLCMYGIFLFVGDIHSSSPAVKTIANPIILEFLFGFALGWAYFEGGALPNKRLMLAFIIIPCALVIAVTLAKSDISLYSLHRFVFFGLPALSIVALFLYLDTNIASIMLLRPIVLIGAASYSIYLTHVLFLNAFLFSSIRLMRIEIPSVYANIMCFIFVVISGAVYYKYIEGPASNIFKKFLLKFSATLNH